VPGADPGGHWLRDGAGIVRAAGARLPGHRLTTNRWSARFALQSVTGNGADDVLVLSNRRRSIPPRRGLPSLCPSGFRTFRRGGGLRRHAHGLVTGKETREIGRDLPRGLAVYR